MLDLTFGEQVKIVLGRRGMTIKDLAEEIEERTGKKMSRQNLTQRLGRDNFQEQDMRMIAGILGCPFRLDILGEEVSPSAELSVEREAVSEEEFSLERDITIGELVDINQQLDELESAGNKSGEQVLYIMRKGSVESAEVTSELYHVLLDTGLRLRSYDTAPDEEKHSGWLNEILDKYGVTQVPALVILQDGAVAERFEGADIIDGIVSYAKD